MGSGPGDAPRLSPRDRQDGADRHRWRDLPGAATPPALPRGDPDAGRAARAREALGGGSAVPRRGERRAVAVGRGAGRVAVQGACACVTATVGAGVARREPARPRYEGEAPGPGGGDRVPGCARGADGLRPVAGGGPSDRTRYGVMSDGTRGDVVVVYD